MSIATVTPGPGANAWHGSLTLKGQFLARVHAHRLLDELVHGIGWEGGKGCAVGCTFHKYDHAAGAAEIGFPEHLIQLQDAIFEGLKNGASQAWPEQFLEAAAVGADMSMVFPQFGAWLLSVDGPMKKLAKAPHVEGIRALYAEWSTRRVRPAAARWAAAGAAEAAARSAAWLSMRDKLLELMRAAKTTS